MPKVREVQGAPELTVDELATAAGMTRRNVRSYQSRGLLPRGRRAGRQACYGLEHVARLRLIRSLRESGLSLKVIRDLLEQGTAEEELARLSRERLGTMWDKAARVPVTHSLRERYEHVDPDGLQAMLDLGVLVRVGDELHGSAAMLGVAGALFAHGVDLEAIGRVVVAAGRAAAESVPVVQAEAAGVGEEEPGMVIQLAACAFADVLARRLDLF